MATSIFYEGKVISRPGSYSIQDASGLESVGLGAQGIIALIGEGVGGAPVSATMQTKDYIRLNSPAKVRNKFRSGPLREAGVMVFDPSSDADIPAGAQQVIAMKVNQATQASRTFSNGNGTAMTVTSADYGEFTNQIAVEIEDGTGSAKSLTQWFEGDAETSGDVGGDSIFSILYRPPSGGTGWDATGLQVLEGGIRVNAKRTEAGLHPTLLDAALVGSTVEVASNNGGDTTQTITIYGFDEDGVAQTEALALNGTSQVGGAATWSSIIGARLSATTLGDVTIRDVSNTPDILTIGAGSVVSGMTIASGSTVRVSSSDVGDTTQSITVYGISAAGLPQKETLALTGSTVKAGLLTWSAVLGATLSAACTGTVTLEENTGGYVDILSIAPAALTDQLVLGSTMFVSNSKITLYRSAAGGETVLLWGKSASGAVQTEQVVLNGTSPVQTTGSWSQIDVIVLGGVDSGGTVSITAAAIESSNATQETIEQLADFVNARQVANTPDPDGFELTIDTGKLTFNVEDLDLSADAAAATNADPTAVGVIGTNIYNSEQSFYANLFEVLSYYNNSSELVDAERIAFEPQIEDVQIDTITNSTTYTFSIDGHNVTYTSDGSATVAEIQAGLLAFAQADQRIAGRVKFAAQSTNRVRCTARTPAGFVLSEADARLSTVSVQTTAGVGSMPSNTSGPEFLSGGSEGAATVSDYQTALDLLKKVRVNTIVPLTGDPAVHAAVNAHCVYMAGLGRNERDAIMGALDTALEDVPTKTEFKSQVIQLNSRHCRLVGQEIERFDTAGVRTAFSPIYAAAIAAGMQAGAPIGTSLTFKYANVLSVRGDDATWNPLDDVEEMIQGGCLFLEEVDGIGFRFVRNITTWLKSNNLVYTEASVNAAANYATYEFRTELETVIGKRGFAGTLSAIRGRAQTKLNLLTDAGTITDWRSLTFDLTADVLDVSVEMAPVVPINFALTTVHLVTRSLAA